MAKPLPWPDMSDSCPAPPLALSGRSDAFGWRPTLNSHTKRVRGIGGSNPPVAAKPIEGFAAIRRLFPILIHYPSHRRPRRSAEAGIPRVPARGTNVKVPRIPATRRSR
jgi:hypothetical protein